MDLWWLIRRKISNSIVTILKKDVPLYVLYVIIFSVNQRPSLSVYDRRTKLSVFVTSAISIPREKGATSRRRRFSIFPEASAERMAASTAAPQANGLLWVEALVGFLAGVKELGNEFDDRGNTVEPPTKTIS